MKSSRSILLIASATLVLMLIAGGVAVRVGAGESTYGQTRLFSEVMSHVMEHYVDPVEAQRLLDGAYKGMLSGLDANGAFLTPDEVEAWKKGDGGGPADPGLRVLKAGRSLQVISLVEGGSAEESGIEIGDQIRNVDGVSIQDLSLDQAWRLISGAPGSIVELDVLHTSDGYRREEIEVVRSARDEEPFEIVESDGAVVLRIIDMARVPTVTLGDRLRGLAESGKRLVVDLRNLADLDPRNVVPVAGLFTAGTVLNLRDRAGKVVDSLQSSQVEPAWHGTLGVIVNGATAGSGEALAQVLKDELEATVVGESTYGFGAEAELYELDNGSGLLVSSSLWESRQGRKWNGEGIIPDHVIRGTGDDFETMAADQLKQAIDYLRSLEPARREAA